MLQCELKMIEITKTQTHGFPFEVSWAFQYYFLSIDDHKWFKPGLFNLVDEILIISMMFQKQFTSIVRYESMPQKHAQ